jgi:uncharacterized protein YjbJ (UPF0337 family)
MNWDQIQGNWMQFKAGVRGNWVKLTDEDLTRIGGRATNWSNACKRVMASARTKRSGRSRPG